MPNVVESDGEARSQQSIDRLSDITVVDCDVHEVNPDQSIYETYIDDRWKDKVRHQTRTDDPLTHSIRGTHSFDVDPTPHGMQGDVSPTSPEGLDAFMNRMNTDYIILHGHDTNGVPAIPDKRFAAALCTAYNDFLLDQFLDQYEGMKATIKVAPQAPNLAAEEIDRMADESDMVGVGILPAAPNNLLGDSFYDPIYEAASNAGLPIDYHPSQSNAPWAKMWGGQGLHSTVEALTAYPHHMYVHIPSLIFQGVLERYPDVNHVFLEQGLSWIPWMEGRLDKTYERRKHDLPHLSKKPSEYLREQFYFGTQPMEDPAGPGNIQTLFELINAEERLVYSSDFPHFDYDYPSILTIPDLPQGILSQIFGGNALEVYDF